jgi:HEAT repeat protein
VRHLPAAALLCATLACGRGEGARSDLASDVPERRAAAVAALAASRDESAVAALLVAQQDPSALVRKAAAGALTARGGPRSVEGLARLLLDPDQEVVVTAARGMGAIAHASGSPDARATAALQREASVALAAAYGRADARARGEIAAALAALGTSLREAVEAEARLLWERDVRVLATGTSREKAGAAEELGRSGRTDAVRRLLPLLKGGSRETRVAAAAARGLGWAGDRAAREALEDALLDGDAVLAEAAAGALAALADPAASEALARAGATGPVRIAAASVRALEALPRAPEVGVALCEIAVRHPDPAVAERAARGTRDRETDCPDQPLTVRIARRGQDALAALAALGALGLPPDRLARPAERALALLQPGVEPALRAAAARALGLARHGPSGPALARRAQALRERLAESRQRWVPGGLPRTAAPGFGKEPPPPEEIALRPLPQDTVPPPPPGRIAPVEPGDAAEMAAVVLALARLEVPGAAPLAVELSSDPDPRIRAGAVEALGKVKGDDAVRRLTAALDDPDEAVRRSAAEGLGRPGAPVAAALAAALERASGAAWREALARALGETGDPSAVAPLVPLLAGPEAPAAAAALGRLGTRDAVPPLLQLLERRQMHGRVEALEALGAVATADAGPAIAAELTSDRPETRAAAARALGRLRHAGASSTLEALRGDYFADVRRAAVEALARLPSGPPRRR